MKKWDRVELDGLYYRGTGWIIQVKEDPHRDTEWVMQAPVLEEKQTGRVRRTPRGFQEIYLGESDLAAGRVWVVQEDDEAGYHNSRPMQLRARRERAIARLNRMRTKARLRCTEQGICLVCGQAATVTHLGAGMSSGNPSWLNPLWVCLACINREFGRDHESV